MQGSLVDLSIKPTSAADDGRSSHVMNLTGIRNLMVLFAQCFAPMHLSESRLTTATCFVKFDDLAVQKYRNIPLIWPALLRFPVAEVEGEKRYRKVTDEKLDIW